MIYPGRDHHQEAIESDVSDSDESIVASSELKQVREDSSYWKRLYEENRKNEKLIVHMEKLSEIHELLKQISSRPLCHCRNQVSPPLGKIMVSLQVAVNWIPM